MEKQIPLVYQIYLAKISTYARDGRILTESFKKILMVYFRLPKNYIKSVLHEMHEMNLIRMCNHKYIWILH
jgi:hypothetical protein